MADETFIPTLGESQMDIVSSNENKVEYLVAFTLINPGFTSENLEHKMVSFSSLLAEYTIEEAVERYELLLQQLINEHCPDANYIAQVSTTNITPVEVDIQIVVTDTSGTTVLRYEHMVKRLNEDEDN